MNVDPAQTTRVFDFETDDEGSPFDYASDGVLGKGCGMIRRDGNIIIEEDLCQKFFIHAYVVGFQGETITGGDEDEIIIQSQKTSHSFETAAPGISITYNSKNNNDYKINKVQFSFIIIGIRAWSSTEYPVQLTNIDDFTAFAVSALSTGGTKSGILLDLGLSGSPNEQVMNRIPSLSHIFCGLASIVFDDGEDDVVIHIDDVDYDDFFDQGIPGPN